MGQFPVPALRVYRSMFAIAAFAVLASSLPCITGVAKADDIATQDSTGPKVDLDILNANLLSVVRSLRLESGAQIVVEGGDKAYNSVSLTVSGPLSSVLNYVAMSAGATVTRNSDGVYVLRPVGASTQGEGNTDVASYNVAPTPVAAANDQDSDADQAGPFHWERVRLQYINPKFVLMMLKDKEGERDVTANDRDDAQQLQDDSRPTVYIPRPGFTVSPDNTGGQSVQPSVPNGENISGGNNATQANQFTTDQSNQAQQFVPPFQQNGNGGGFAPDQNGGGGPGGGRAGAAQGASLRPDGIKSIIADSQDNSLLVQGNAEGIQELRQIIQLLDIPSKQVQIKAEFITASVAKVDQFGINFQLVPAPNISTSFEPTANTGSVNVIFSEGNLVANMEAELSTTASKVVSAPLVTTTNNTAATIQFNETIPYLSSTTNVTGSGTATTSNSTSFITVSSGLTVTPQVNGDNSVTMDLTLPNSSETTTSAGPETTTQVIHTLRTVANGETMVLGGLVSKNDSNARESVPFLADIPVIGSLFRTRDTNIADTELLIFITPTVLPYPGQNEPPTPAIDSGVGVTP